MTTSTILADTLIQVEDLYGDWHAAAIGPGILCQSTNPDQATPGVQTVAWDHGTDRVNCRSCLYEVAAIGLRSLPPRRHGERVA